MNFLISRTGTIPVNRQAGADAYLEAVRQLKAGQLVGVYPEATISRAFVLKDFKSGAARMALRGAGADHPLHRVGSPPGVDKGSSEASWAATRFHSQSGTATPLPPVGTSAELDAVLRAADVGHPA